MTLRRRLVTLAASVALALGLPTAFAAPAQAASFTWMIYGDSLQMSTDGPFWDPCHHYVHFVYPHSMDGHIVSYSVQSLDPLAVPAPWSAPSNGQLNAGYHNWSQLECAADTVHRPSDFWLWLTVDQSPV
jgi:hypothetical protein